MYKWSFTLMIEDVAYAENEYEAWAQFRNRVIDRFYGPINEQITREEEVTPEASTPESP